MYLLNKHLIQFCDLSTFKMRYKLVFTFLEFSTLQFFGLFDQRITPNSPRKMRYPLHTESEATLMPFNFPPPVPLCNILSRSVMSDCLQPHGLQPTRLLCPWDFPGKSTGVGCYFLLQGIFLTQGSNPCLLHCRQMLYHLSHQGTHHNILSSPFLVQFLFIP